MWMPMISTRRAFDQSVTAPTGPDGVLALLDAGAVVLMATGGGLVAIGRRVEP